MLIITKSRNTASISWCYNSVKQQCLISMKHVTIVSINSIYLYGTRVTKVVLSNSVSSVLSNRI